MSAQKEGTEKVFLIILLSVVNKKACHINLGCVGGVGAIGRSVQLVIALREEKESHSLCENVATTKEPLELQ